jgi:hypothetical protein
MTIVDGGTHDEQETRAPGCVRLDIAVGAARVVVSGVLTAGVSAAAQEMLLEALESRSTAVVLDLQATLDPTAHEALSRLLDVAQRCCWGARRRLDVTATDPRVRDLLAAAGIWS